MKLTEAVLKQLIMEVLEEGMNTADQLPDDVYIVAFMHKENKAMFAFSDSEGEVLMPWMSSTDEENDVWGDVSFWLPGSKKYPCSNACIVAVTEVSKGWGPLLYDLAMEAATILGNSLTPDRSTVSDEAQSVWKYYLNKRTDIQVAQLDNEKDSFENGIDDDCTQKAARASSKSGEWMNSPLSKVYSKEPTTLRQLEASGKFINKIPNLKF